MADHARPAPAARGGDPVEEAAQSFLKGIHALRTYPRGNEIACHALEHATAALLRVVPIVIEVGPKQISWGEGHAIDTATDRVGISAALYRDGVRRLEIREGLDAAEIERLLLTLAERINPDDLSEDYVTRLWEAELSHVRVLAIDPYLDVEIPEDVLEGQHKPDLATEEIPLNPEDDVPPPPEEAFRIRKGDALRIAREVAQSNRAPPWTRFIEVVVATIMSPPGLRRADELVVIIETCFQRLIDEGHLEEAVRLLRRLKDSLPPGAMPGLLEALGRMASGDRLRPLAKALDASEAPHEHARPLLLLLKEAVIPTLLDFMADAGNAEAQHFYASLLTEIGVPALAASIECFRLGDAETKLLLAPVLGKLGGPEAAGALAAELQGGDASLRRELVRALGMVRDEQAGKTLFQIALGDVDESCRILALRALRHSMTSDAQARLIERIGESGVTDEERDLLYLALGRVGDDGVIPFLTKMLKPSWLPGRWNASEARRAASALARLGTPQALGVLEDFASSRRSSLAEICTRAMLEAQRKPR
jgi:HEAT repeat protein